jgi:bacterioferritin-associated ferredoxin
VYVCVCNAVTDRQIRVCVEGGAACLEDLQIDLGVATGCGKCTEMACSFLPSGRHTCLIDNASHHTSHSERARSSALPSSPSPQD